MSEHHHLIHLDKHLGMLVVIILFAALQITLQSEVLKENMSSMLTAKHIEMQPRELSLTGMQDMGISNFFMKKDAKGNQITANFKEIRMLLPNGEQIFIDTFNHGDTITYGKCDDDRDYCEIFQNYMYYGQEICLDARLSDDWGATGFTITHVGDPGCIEEVISNIPQATCGPQ